MKTTILAFLLLAAVTVRADEAALSDGTKSAAYFTEMRMQFARQPDFTAGWVVDSQRVALLKTYNDDDPKEFLAGSEAWLRKCPVDAKVHLMRAGLLLKAGDVPGHLYHRMIFYGLLTSIVTSGDGKSPETAYKVISVDEEYTVLNHIGAKVKSQSLVAGSCDAMAVQFNGADTTLYFDASIPMEALRKSLEPKPGK